MLTAPELFPELVDQADDWQDDEPPPPSIDAPCRACQRPTLSAHRDLCASCEADREGR
jgi:hypothetical protein